MRGAGTHEEEQARAATRQVEVLGWLLLTSSSINLQETLHLSTRRPRLQHSSAQLPAPGLRSGSAGLPPSLHSACHSGPQSQAGELVMTSHHHQRLDLGLNLAPCCAVLTMLGAIPIAFRARPSLSCSVADSFIMNISLQL